METTYRSHSKEPAPHYHPAQVADFTVLEGELTVQMSGQLKILKRGDTLHITSNVVHSMWNRTDSKAVVNWQVRPAMDTEHLLEMVTGLANDGKTNEKGLPNPWQKVLLPTNTPTYFGWQNRLLESRESFSSYSLLSLTC